MNWLPPVALIGSVGIIGGCIIFGVLSEKKEQKRLKSSTTSVVSKEEVEEIFRNPVKPTEVMEDILEKDDTPEPQQATVSDKVTNVVYTSETKRSLQEGHKVQLEEILNKIEQRK